MQIHASWNTQLLRNELVEFFNILLWRILLFRKWNWTIIKCAPDDWGNYWQILKFKFANRITLIGGKLEQARGIPTICHTVLERNPRKKKIKTTHFCVFFNSYVSIIYAWIKTTNRAKLAKKIPFVPLNLNLVDVTKFR